MKKGFTIIEVIVAISVITIGVLAAFSVVQKIISYTFVSSSRLTAAYLAKERIEVVRNKRDTNWLEGQDWTDGIGTTGWAAHAKLPYDTKVTATPITSDEIKVVVEVRWQERGNTYTIAVQENLYNWY